VSRDQDREKVMSMRVFTGEGMIDCHKALKICEGDILLACGYLKFAGCAINLKGGNHREWAMNAGRRYASELRIDAEGVIVKDEANAHKPMEPGL
jgi:translation elongation factor EF-Ts